MDEIDNFMSAFCPWGYRDIESAIKTYELAGKHYDELAADVQQWMDDTDTKIEDVDVCYVAYDSLYQEARTEIETATGKDISNDEPYDHINISGNYLATSLDGRDGDFKALADLIETIPEDNRSKVVAWLHSQVA